MPDLAFTPPPPLTTNLASDLLRARRHQGDQVEFDMQPDWLQGRTTFGGLIAMLSVQAMRDVAGSAWTPEVQLRALQTSFVGPVGAGAMQVQVRTLREGKNVRQIQATALQDGQVAGALLGVFGTERETVLPVIEPERPPTAHTPEASATLPYLPGVTPAFLQRVETAWSEGSLPYSGQHDRHTHIHVRLRDQPAAPLLTPELLTVLLADVPPTPLLSHFKKPIPASSVSWDLELRRLPHTPPADGWWRVDTEVLAAAGGYVNQVTRLWAPSGQLASLGYQVVTVYG